MNLTVTICTRNRAKSLHRTLTSMTQMDVPKGIGWELLIVNNGSTDETDSVIAQFKSALPVRREFEAQRGISNARNCAVKAAKGEYLIWTDDDVIVDRGWLAAYAEAFARWPESAIFGGRIIPEFEEPAPAWLKESWRVVEGVFAYRDLGDDPVPLTLEGRRIPFGANWAVRMAEQRAYPYNPELGPGSPKALYGEETDVIASMLRDGKKGRWVPGSKVRHCIGSERQNLTYIGNYYRTHGRVLAYYDRDKKVPLLFGAPRWLWRRLLVDSCRYYFRRLTSAPAVWLDAYATRAVDRGMLEYWRRSKIE